MNHCYNLYKTTTISSGKLSNFFQNLQISHRPEKRGLCEVRVFRVFGMPCKKEGGLVIVVVRDDWLYINKGLAVLFEREGGGLVYKKRRAREDRSL